MTIPRFGLNRFDSRSEDAFASDVRRAEQLGRDAAHPPDSQLNALWDAVVRQLGG